MSPRVRTAARRLFSWPPEQRAMTTTEGQLRLGSHLFLKSALDDLLDLRRVLRGVEDGRSREPQRHVRHSRLSQDLRTKRAANKIKDSSAAANDQNLRFQSERHHLHNHLSTQAPLVPYGDVQHYCCSILCSCAQTIIADPRKCSVSAPPTTVTFVAPHTT